MFTRCPACHTVHPLNAALLAQGRGRYRCVKCGKVSNALEALFDQWPDAGREAPSAGELPELGAGLKLEPSEPADATPEEQALLSEQEAAGTGGTATRLRLRRLAWISAAVILLVVITLSLGRFFGVAFFSQEGMQAVLTDWGLKQAPPEKPFRDVSQIELVGREMKPHPSRPQVLLLSATIVNRAERIQPYPSIDVTLLDVQGRQLKRQLFRPGDYLSRSSELRDGMSPGAYFAFSLELLDPGDQAVGFELQFR